MSDITKVTSNNNRVPVTGSTVNVDSVANAPEHSLYLLADSMVYIKGGVVGVPLTFIGIDGDRYVNW